MLGTLSCTKEDYAFIITFTLAVCKEKGQIPYLTESHENRHGCRNKVRLDPELSPSTHEFELKKLKLKRSLWQKHDPTPQESQAMKPTANFAVV